MLTAHARVETARAKRYLSQFCKHAAAMGGHRGQGPVGHLRGMLARREVDIHAEWSETRGTVRLEPWGSCTVTADATGLNLSVEAADEQSLLRIQEVVTSDFERFGKREGLTVTWTDSEGHTAIADKGEGRPA